MNLLKYRWLNIGILFTVLIAAIVSWAVLGLNLGVDFTGGTNIRFPVNRAVTSTEVEEALSTPELQKLDLKLSSPQPYSYIDAEGNQKYGVLVHTRFLTAEEQKSVVGTLEKTFGSLTDGGAGLDIYGVDPLIGKELVSNTIIAVIISCFLILVYVAFRFEFKSGVAGVIALIHDVLFVIGVFALLRKEISATFVAAILTIIGYSINDTIVIFDRIRENLQFRKKDESFESVVNLSILQTMRRSLNTSITTVLAILALYFVGGPAIKEFCLALIIGVTAGSYSSIFVASPLWVVWRNWEEKKRLKGKVAAAGTK
ncbi:MAG TPA: protein translocase subunit SecF [Bacillota bacterium]|nr:protein translocase subunit SecF [Bacillota bacterium]HPT67030.1 protein translocase subunit SecF [Bacillota bacterium]